MYTFIAETCRSFNKNVIVSSFSTKKESIVRSYNGFFAFLLHVYDYILFVDQKNIKSNRLLWVLWGKLRKNLCIIFLL